MLNKFNKLHGLLPSPMSKRTTMKAWQYAKGTSARTLRGKLEDSLVLNTEAAVPDKSVLAHNQLIIEVFSAAINPIDYKAPESGWFGRTFALGQGAQPGLDFSGRIVGKHPSNTTFAEGQRVFGSLAKASKYGTLAQYTVATTAEIAPWPEGISADQAAALGMSAGTAYYSLLPYIKDKKGWHVFINGGSGGVGTFTIQFAKLMGAKVTATASAANVDFVKSLGADEVIDYQEVDVITELGRRGSIFNLVVDNVGTPKDLYQRSGDFLKPDGTYMQVAANPTWNETWPNLKNMAVSAVVKWHQGSFRFIMERGDGADSALFGQWAAEGKLIPVVGERFAFEDVTRAYRKLREGHSRGKIIVHIKGEEADKI